MQAAVTLSHSLSLHPTPFFTHSRQPIMNRYCSVFVFHLSNSTYRFVAGWTPPQLHHKTTIRIVPNQLLNMINSSKKRMVPNQTQNQMRILLQVKLCMRCNDTEYIFLPLQPMTFLALLFPAQLPINQFNCFFSLMHPHVNHQN